MLFSLIKLTTFISKNIEYKVWKSKAHSIKEFSNFEPGKIFKRGLYDPFFVYDTYIETNYIMTFEIKMTQDEIIEGLRSTCIRNNNVFFIEIRSSGK